MPNFPSSLDDAGHDAFDLGLINAARLTRRHLEMSAFNDQDDSDVRLDTYRPLRVPWWIESKYETSWTIADYREWASKRLRGALGRSGSGVIDERDEQHGRLIDHLAHRLVYNAVPLHVGFRYDSGVAYDADDVVKRTRNEALAVVANKSIYTESDVHPLWKRGRLHQCEAGTLRMVDATRAQIDRARALLGAEMNLADKTTGPYADAIRTATPELLSLDDRHLMYLSGTLRKEFHAILDEETEMRALKERLAICVVELWLQVNPTSDESIAAMREEGKPDTREGSPREVIEAYVMPAIEAGDAERLRGLVPLLGYHTIGAVTMDDAGSLDLAIRAWSAVVKTVQGVSPRVMDLAFLACKIGLASNLDELRALRRQA